MANLRTHVGYSRLVGRACLLRRPLVVTALLLACPLAFCGCTSAKSPAARDGSRRIVDDAFASGANQPPNATTLYALAQILAAQGREDECEDVLGRITQQYPKYLPAYADLAQLYVRSNRAADAERVLSAGLVHAPTDPVLLNNLGMCWFLREGYAKALERFEAASRAAPADRVSRANTAAALGMLGRYDEAERIYKQVLDGPEAVRTNLAVLREARRIRADRERASAAARDATPRRTSETPTTPEAEVTGAPASARMTPEG